MSYVNIGYYAPEKGSPGLLRSSTAFSKKVEKHLGIRLQVCTSSLEITLVIGLSG